jgi:hypothetical protein
MDQGLGGQGDIDPLAAQDLDDCRRGLGIDDARQLPIPTGMHWDVKSRTAALKRQYHCGVDASGFGDGHKRRRQRKIARLMKHMAMDLYLGAFRSSSSCNSDSRLSSS